MKKAIVLVLTLLAIVYFGLDGSRTMIYNTYNTTDKINDAGA